MREDAESLQVLTSKDADKRTENLDDKDTDLCGSRCRRE